MILTLYNSQISSPFICKALKRCGPFKPTLFQYWIRMLDGEDRIPVNVQRNPVRGL